MNVTLQAAVGRLVASAKRAGLTPLPRGREWTFRCPVCGERRVTMALNPGGAIELTCDGHHGAEGVLEVLGLDRRPVRF